MDCNYICLNELCGLRYPHHNNDDTITTTTYASNTLSGKWVNLPYLTETIDDKNDTRISLNNVYYDGLAEGQIGDGKLSSEKLWNNNPSPGAVDAVTSYEYDLKGNVKKVISPNGLETNILVEYPSETGVYMKETKTLPSGLTTIVKFDNYGRPFEMTDIYGDIQSFEFDNYGRIIKIFETIDSKEYATKEFDYSYDAINYRFKAEARYLDTQNLPTDPLTLTIDDYLRMQFYKDGLGRSIQTKSESVVNGVQCWVVSGMNQYDSMGRVVRTGSITTADFTDDEYIPQTSLESPIIEYNFDEFGRLEGASDSSGMTINISYLVGVDNDTSRPYERVVGMVEASDNQGHLKKLYKDISLRDVREEILKDDSTYAVRRFEYNLHGWSKLIEPYADRTGEKQTDSLGDLIWMRSPDAGKFEYIYNNKGLITQEKQYGKNESDWREINYSFDNLNRISSIDYAGTENDIYYEFYGTDAGVNKYARSSIKNIKKGEEANPYFKVEYVYDQFSIEENKTIKDRSNNDLQYNSKYTYDIQGRIKELIYPDGEAVNYSYDQSGYLNRIEGNQIYIDNIRYNEYGQRTYLKYGNDSEMTYTYDPTTKLLDVFTTKDSSGNEILKYDYDFDLSGNIRKITDSPNGITKSTQNYSYDLMGRLTHADGNYKSGTETYSRDFEFYDDDRIKTKSFENGMIFTYNYLANSHAVSNISITNGESGKTDIDFSYDDYGNLTRKETFVDIVSPEHQDYTYDEANCHG